MPKLMSISKDLIYRSLEQSIFMLIFLLIWLAIYLPIKRLDAITHANSKKEVLLYIYVPRGYNIEINDIMYEIRQYNENQQGYTVLKVNTEYDSIVSVQKIPKESIQKVKRVGGVQLKWEGGRLSSTNLNSKEPVIVQWHGDTIYIEFDRS